MRSEAGPSSWATPSFLRWNRFLNPITPAHSKAAPFLAVVCLVLVFLFFLMLPASSGLEGPENKRPLKGFAETHLLQPDASLCPAQSPGLGGAFLGVHGQGFQLIHLPKGIRLHPTRAVSEKKIPPPQTDLEPTDSVSRWGGGLGVPQFHLFSLQQGKWKP